MAETMETQESVAGLGGLKRKDQLTGSVTRTELYGAFINVGVGTPAILHVSQLKGSNRIKDVLKVGDEVTVWVDKADVEKNQLIVTMIEPLAVEWGDLKEGNTYTGKITRLENFGAFVDIGAEKEGLVHISEISHDYIRHPSQAVNVGDEAEVKVLSFSKRKRRINLSIKSLIAEPEKEVEDYIGEVFDLEEEEQEDMPTSMEIALRRAMGDSAPPRPKSGKKGRRQQRHSRRRRQVQNELLDRTLEYTR